MNRRLLASWLSLAFVVLVALEVPLGISYARGQRRDTLSKLERDAVAVGSLAEDTLQTGGTVGPLTGLAQRYLDETGGRIVIVDRRGDSIVDPSASIPRDFATRPEIAQALAGRVAAGERNSQTLGGGLLYVAVPVASSGVVHGAVRITYPTSELDARIRRYALRLAAIAGIVLAVTALVGFLLSRSVTRPLRALEQAVGQAGLRDLSVRVPADAGPPEVRSLARSFNETVARLEELVGAQEAFVADASHQLRTPLTALRLRLENGDVAGALAETERLARLVDALLALARVEASSAETVDLSEAVSERVDAWTPLAADRAVDLEADVEGQALVGRDRLGQVLDNLLANAIAVAPPGTAVTITGRASDLHVRDRGPGMSEVERARAFDRFWSKAGGSGLGLPIVRRLVEIDGGAVELRNAEGGGLDAVLRLRPAPADVRSALLYPVGGS